MVATMDKTPDQIARTWPGGAPDQETFDLMCKLDDLQTWMTLMMCKQVPRAREASDLVQETRAFIVSRLYPRAILQAQENTNAD